MAGFIEGDFAQSHVKFTDAMVADFDRLSEDRSPVHFDSEHALDLGFERPIVHGFLVSSMYSVLLGSHLPGTGSIIQKVSVDMLAPVHVGDAVHFTVTVTRISEGVGAVSLALSAINQHGKPVSRGSAVCVVRSS